MSEQVTTTSPICPGERALMPNLSGNARYLRMVFGVYYQGAYPSFEVIYVTEHPFKLTPASINSLEAQVLALFVAQDMETAPLAATYICFSGVEMSPDDVTAAGWRVISG